MPDPPPRLLDQVRHRIRRLEYSFRTEKTYVHWIRRFILFHGKRHPKEMGAPEVEAFLTHLAVKGRVSASTQNQALSAILFLYRQVLQQDLPWLEGIVRAKRPQRVPVVLSRAEVAAVPGRLGEPFWLMGSLLYGAGLRVSECLRLRVKDVEFDYRQVTVRDGKGARGRVTTLPYESLESDYDIRTVQELLGHKDVSTTMIYTHVLKRGGRGVRSPLD